MTKAIENAEHAEKVEDRR